MGTDASIGIKVHYLADGSASIFSEESPSHKESSSMSLDASRDGAEDEAPYVSIQDVLPDDRDVVAKPRKRADKLVLCELLVDKASKDEAVCHCGTIRRASTTQRAQCYMAVLWSTRRPQTVSTMDPSIRGLEPAMSIILQVVQCGTLASAEHSLGDLACKPRLHLRDKLPCLLTKPYNNSDTGGVANTSSCFWRLCELTSAKCNLSQSGACAEHHAAKTGRGRLLVQLRTSAGGILCHALSRLLRHRQGIDVSLVIGADATNVMKIHCLLCCGASISSEQSPSLKEPSSLSLDASRVGAQDDVSCVSSEFAIEDALPNVDVEAKPRNKDDRLLLCDLLVDKGSQEATACHCRTSHASTPQRAQCLMAALWSAGRPQTVR
ncbi:hypothetical protein HPB52_018594 [Rhipicephalus sanguineus]|uniref:Uncharacterized protein n=1 Tax=Rhipicephalus sanguineus TaxID=34632 RepID=A0A9D4TBA0_RHISA|nr:hypothetical protein HPB52_018594 [Rhipicephalus sanguineus]